MKKIAIIAAVALTLTACTSTDPYTGEQKVNKTSKGAIGGAVVGAIIGQLEGGDTESTLKAAAAGGALGAGVGYYFDRQEKALREELEKTGVGIRRVRENQLELVMPGNLTFNTNSSSISPNSYEVLNSISVVLDKFKKSTISIEGYTDNTGNDNINTKLSQERADAVYYYLNAKGITKSRMDSIGYGSKDPITSNSSAAGRSENRRVEIQIIGNNG